MKLAVIGSGNIGKSIGGWASKAGYEVIFSSRNEQHALEAAKITGKNSRAGSIKDAVEKADIVLLAVPYGAVKDILTDLGTRLNGKVLVDVTNPLSPDFSSLTLGFSTSAAEEIQKLVPGAKVVKAFNTIFAAVYDAQNPIIKGGKISVFFAADDKDAKNKVADLISKKACAAK